MFKRQRYLYVENVNWENPPMSTKPLDHEHREKLKALMMGKTWRQTAQAWGIDRGTLAEAALGLPKQAGVRCLIETRLREVKIPV